MSAIRRRTVPALAPDISAPPLVAARPTPAGPALSAFGVDGLASDAALAALGARLGAVRLVFAATVPQRCCAGHSPAFVAVGPEDPALTTLERPALEALRAGRAVPGCGLRALCGGIVTLPGLEVEIAPAADLGAGLEHVVVLALADAARGLCLAGEAGTMAPRTVAIVRGDAVPPAPWQPASGARGGVGLDAGLSWPAERETAT